MPVLVHGVIYLTIHRARDLPAHETIKSKVSGFFKQLVGKKNVDDYVGVYCKVEVGNVKVAKTSKFSHGDELNPEWEQFFRADLAHESDDIKIIVKGDTAGPDKTLGILLLDGEDIMNNPNHPEQWKLLSCKGSLPFQRDKDWFPLANKHGKLNGAFIKISVKFKPAEAAKKTYDMYDTYFGSRKRCHVTLYQDAITPQDPLFDEIGLANGSTYQATNAWKDLYEAILNAKEFIYVTGWSVWAEVVLIRDGQEEEVTLGELLKQKANEGVQVRALVWDEKASTALTPGLMGTHDEETKCYFEDTECEFLLVYRKKHGQGVLVNQLYSTCYSHHQKCIIMDAEHTEDEEKRRLVAFLGGLDVTSGRYDSTEHPLFSTLTTVHKNDFYQNCVTVPAENGPRQPWHDIHSKIEGALVLDTVRNFEERWLKQAPSNMKRKLIDIKGNPKFDFRCSGPNMEEDGPWTCQLYRSITADSANFQDDLGDRLTRKAHGVVDDSIHRCYVQQIRQAEKYIFIENQYFLGSAYAWKEAELPKAHHVIPFELTSKIIKKIKAGEHFCVYVIIPMYPEGDPTTSAVQEILFWQTNTLRMMYTRIAKAIKEHGLDTKPTDYLAFFCLGKREASIPDDVPMPEEGQQVAVKLRNTRRFMIYVHSKMIIVDDSFILVGSANINQRSMAGTRDTEIAVGTYQPDHVLADGVLPKGKVGAFRKALWVEHLNTYESEFEDPSTPECMSKVRELAQQNWDIYAGDEVQDTPGHLLNYPIRVEPETGNVWPLEGCPKFPDTEAFVLGTQSKMLPNKLTT